MFVFNIEVSEGSRCESWFSQSSAVCKEDVKGDGEYSILLVNRWRLCIPDQALWGHWGAWRGESGDPVKEVQPTSWEEESSSKQHLMISSCLLLEIFSLGKQFWSRISSSVTMRCYDIIVLLWYHSLDFDITTDIINMISQAWYHIWYHSKKYDINICFLTMISYKWYHLNDIIYMISYMISYLIS